MSSNNSREKNAKGWENEHKMKKKNVEKRGVCEH